MTVLSLPRGDVRLAADLSEAVHDAPKSRLLVAWGRMTMIIEDTGGGRVGDGSESP